MVQYVLYIQINTNMFDHLKIDTYMAKIHQDGRSIENMHVLSSTLVHSTHSCEANKYKIFKPFFNERKLVLGLQHVKVKVKKVQMEKFRNIKSLP